MLSDLCELNNLRTLSNFHQFLSVQVQQDCGTVHKIKPQESKIIRTASKQKGNLSQCEILQRFITGFYCWRTTFFTCTITRKTRIHENRQGNILNTLKLSRQNKIMSSYRILMMLENSMIAVLLINILLKQTPENTLNSSFFKD